MKTERIRKWLIRSKVTMEKHLKMGIEEGDIIEGEEDDENDEYVKKI